VIRTWAEPVAASVDDMRITGGKASRHILRAPKGLDVRPTPDLVKQAVFNSLGERVVGAKILELFAGTGALTLDSLSRGAAHAVCIEKSRRHAGIIRQNADGLGLPAGVLEVRVQDVFQAIPQLGESRRTFDLILADPPYGEKNVGRRSNSLAQQLLDDSQLLLLLNPEGLLVLGHARRDALSIPEHWQEKKMLKHGDSWMRFLLARPQTKIRETCPENSDANHP
jgi:16S rRNA (guanine966-N2)-methyltransferase